MKTLAITISVIGLALAGAEVSDIETQVVSCTVGVVLFAGGMFYLGRTLE